MTASRWSAFLLLCPLLALFAPQAFAQPKAPLILPPPQAPTLNPVLPLGLQRGQSVELNLTGTNLASPTGFLTSFPAKVTIPTDNNNGKDAGKVRVKVEVPADAPMGVHTVRIATTQGLSNKRLICVDELPTIMEVDTNRGKATAQVIAIPAVITGRTDGEQSDYFKFSVKAGQRLTFEVLGRRFGSTLDPILMLHNATTGREVPGLYSDDSPGLQSDARLTHTFTEAGDYLIELRDSTHRGGADFFYRLRIGDFPTAITAFPVALKRGTKANISFTGPLVDGVAPVEITASTDPTIAIMNVTPKFTNVPGSSSGWPMPVELTDIDEITEMEPNNEPAKANKLPVPGGVTGRFLEKSDVDCFQITAKKGIKYTLNIETYEIGSPAEVFVIIKDAKNAELARTNPTAPGKLEWTAPADGDFFLVVEHLNFVHGPNEVYHLTITPPEPDFDVELGMDRFEVGPSGIALIPIDAINRRNFTDPVELTIVGPAGVTGQLTLGVIAPQPNLPIAFLPVQVAATTPKGAYPIQVRAKATINGKEVIRMGRTPASAKTLFANLAYVPLEFTTRPALAVTDAPLFTLAVQPMTPDAVRGLPWTVKVIATRSAGFTDEIALAALALPPNVAAAVKPIPKDKNEIDIVITPAANAPMGSFPIVLRGQTKHQMRDVAYFAPPVPLSIALPFELKVEGAPVMLKIGQKAKVKVTAVRKGGYAGPIALEVRNLPANVTAPKLNIDMGKNDVEVELTAAGNAAEGEKADVNVLGTAPAAANQQAASGNFVIKIVK